MVEACHAADVHLKKAVEVIVTEHFKRGFFERGAVQDFVDQHICHWEKRNDDYFAWADECAERLMKEAKAAKKVARAKVAEVKAAKVSAAKPKAGSRH